LEVGNLAVVACVLGKATKKKSSTFSGKRCTPREKNPGYAYCQI